MKRCCCIVFVLLLLVGCSRTEKSIHESKPGESGIEGVPYPVPGASATSPDGTKMVSVGNVVSVGNGGIVQIVDFESWEVLHTFEGHTDQVRSVRFSPDGEKIITASDDKTIRIVSTDSGKELRLFTHTGGIIFAVFSPDETQIATGSKDGTTRLWDANLEKELQTFEGHTGEVLSITFSPDGKKIATSSSDGTARLWDIESGKELQKLEGLRGEHVSQFLPDGTGVIVVGDQAFVWDLEEESHF